MRDCINEILEDTNDSSDDEDGPYIELELDTKPTPTCYNDEMRISISSTICVTLPEVQKESTRVDSSEPKVDEGGSEIEFPAQNQLFGTNVSFIQRPRGLWEIPQPGFQTTMLGTSSTRLIPYDNVDVYASTRKQSSLTRTTTTTNGIMMKLLIKFKGTKIGALFASLIKKPRQPSQVNNAHKSSKKSKTNFHDQSGRRDQAIRRSKRSCSVMELDLGALRGVLFNSVGVMSNIGKKGSCRSKRSSTSCNTSPIHDEDFSSLCSHHHENSIQAAISYCKSSLGQTSDFTFTSSITSTPSPSQFVA